MSRPRPPWTDAPALRRWRTAASAPYFDASSNGMPCEPAGMAPAAQSRRTTSAVDGRLVAQARERSERVVPWCSFAAFGEPPAASHLRTVSRSPSRAAVDTLSGRSSLVWDWSVGSKNDCNSLIVWPEEREREARGAGESGQEVTQSAIATWDDELASCKTLGIHALLPLHRD